MNIYESTKCLEPVENGWIRCMCVSDTHCAHERLTQELDRLCLLGASVLLHAGDLTEIGSQKELEHVSTWLGSYAERGVQCILVAGNHDIALDDELHCERSGCEQWHQDEECCLKRGEALRMFTDRNVTVLHNQSVLLSNSDIRVFGSSFQPRQPKMRRQMAYGLPRGRALQAAWEDAFAQQYERQGNYDRPFDILLTHTPPARILDDGKGDDALRACLRRMRRVEKPRVHIFGHVHSGRGIHVEDRIAFVNAASIDRGMGGRERGDDVTILTPFILDLKKEE